MFASPSAHHDLGTNNWLNIDLSIKGVLFTRPEARGEGEGERGVPLAERLTDCCLFLSARILAGVAGSALSER